MIYLFPTNLFASEIYIKYIQNGVPAGKNLILR